MLGVKLFMSFGLTMIYLIIETFADMKHDKTNASEYTKSRKYMTMDLLFKASFVGSYFALLYMIWEGD